MNKSLNFRVSSGLKSVIGKELIVDDFIAVFELVKNSFDSHASKVEIIFDKNDFGEDCLIIRDDGKGMDRKDVIDKWLFVAYSAKRDGTEDYRDEIKSSRIQAGSKGIGRFSCDRLGEKLQIFSRKSPNSRFTHLAVNWNDFEEDPKENFIEIPVIVTNTPKNPHKLEVGTVLEITGLREDWDRDKFLELRKSLEKLINPSQGNDSGGFSIHLSVPSELGQDKFVESEEQWNRVNGRIKNFLFEDLGLKTTQIEVSIDRTGKLITTRLVDRGALIYQIKEKNPFKYRIPESQGRNQKTGFLRNIRVHLFALNQPAKRHFTIYMGLPVVRYGSVFLYKNGFRIYPFGMVGDDSLGIDLRKGQVGSRALGSRDLVGRIEINGKNPDFKEASSRDGGFIRNSAFDQMVKLVREFALKRLERFTIDVIKFGFTDEPLEAKILGKDGVKEETLEIIASLSGAENVVDVDFDRKFLDILASRSEKSLSSLLTNFKRIAAESDNTALAKDARKAERQLKLLRKQKEEAEKEKEQAEADAEAAEEEARKAEEEKEKAERETEEAKDELRRRTSQTLFLKSVVSRDLEHVISLHHQIGISAGTIENYAVNVSQKLSKGEKVSEDYLRSFVKNIVRQAKSIRAITNFATKAKFNLDSVIAKDTDIVLFVKEYVTNVCADIYRTAHDTPAKFRVEIPKRFKAIFKFKPIEITMILDNLISNSMKHGAGSMEFILEKPDAKTFQLTIRDDGEGIPKKLRKSIFEIGYSTTEGSGLGLPHVREALSEMNGSISLSDDYEEGAEFLIRLPL